jgi:hypothetical protein
MGTIIDLAIVDYRLPIMSNKLPISECHISQLIGYRCGLQITFTFVTKEGRRASR